MSFIGLMLEREEREETDDTVRVRWGECNVKLEIEIVISDTSYSLIHPSLNTEQSFVNMMETGLLVISILTRPD